MKLVLCRECHDLFGLREDAWRRCLCGKVAGCYREDGDQAIVAGPCLVYGFSNRVFAAGRGEAWRYDEANGKITRYATPEKAARSERLPA